MPRYGGAVVCLRAADAALSWLASLPTGHTGGPSRRLTNHQPDIARLRAGRPHWLVTAAVAQVEIISVESAIALLPLHLTQTELLCQL